MQISYISLLGRELSKVENLQSDHLEDQFAIKSLTQITIIFIKPTLHELRKSTAPTNATIGHTWKITFTNRLFNLLFSNLKPSKIV